MSVNETGLNYWAIGFLWGSARLSGGHLLVQNTNRHFLQKLKELTGIKNKIFKTVTNQGNVSYRLKINQNHDYVQHILNDGYVGRIGNEERNPPESVDKDNEYEFLKGYFSTHFTHDLVTRSGKLVPRLRFYASYNMLDLLNNHLHINLDCTIKKIGNHSSSDVCKILYYQSKKEIDKTMEYMELIK